MKTISSLFSLCRIFVGLVLFLSVCRHAVADETKAVAYGYKAYRSALIKGDGEAAVKWIDGKTINFYETILKAALHYEEDRLERMTFFEQLVVYNVRTIEAKVLSRINGKQLFVLMVSHGWMNKEDVKRLQIGRPKIISKNRAQAPIISRHGKILKKFVFFSKEGDVWKVDVYKMTDLVDQNLEAKWKESDMTRRNFIRKTFENTMKLKFSKSLLIPLHEKLKAGKSESISKQNLPQRESTNLGTF